MHRSLLFLAFCAIPAFADLPQVRAASAMPSGSTWTFDVTVSHLDTGWDHYTDAWGIEAPDSTAFGTRALLHPHVEEQPFTRSLSDISLAEGMTEVRIRSRCNLDGWSETTLPIPL